MMEAGPCSRVGLSGHMEELRSAVFEHAQEGRAGELDVALRGCCAEEVRRLLSTPVQCGAGLETTPLVMGARRGHLEVVRLLLGEHGVDVEQTGMVEFPGHPVIKGASALWCAASIGRLDMVTMLVEEFGAEVNHATITDSTPLRPACFDGFLDVVKYLISKGAEVNRPTNYYRNTCLLIAAYNGHQGVVRFLLENGGRHDLRDFMGQTALHNAAEKGHLSIAMDLIHHGAQFVADHKQLTPLHVACDFSHVEMVQSFLDLGQFTTLDRIHALELLGASFANGSENYSVKKAFSYMREAMVLRCEGKDMQKQPLAPEPVYRNQVESVTLEQLDRLEHDEDAINTEALILKERILGKWSVHVMDIVYRGAVLADRRDYAGCIALWDRALQIKQHNEESLANDLERYGELFSEMLEENFCVDAACMRRVLETCVSEIQTDQHRLRTRSHDPEVARIHGNMKQVLHTVVLLVSALLDTHDPGDPDHHATKRLLYRCVRLQPSVREGGSLLHTVCDCSLQMNEYFIQSLLPRPNPPLVSVILECGMDPNVQDTRGDTPLHTLCRTVNQLAAASKTDRQHVWARARDVCRQLLQHGAHIDQRNTDGKMPSDYTNGLEALLKPQLNRRPLKCLAAVIVRVHSLQCEGVLPPPLIEFVNRH